MRRWSAVIRPLSFLLSFSLFSPSQFRFSQFLCSFKGHEPFADSYAAFIATLRKSFAVSNEAPIPDNIFLSLPIIPGHPVVFRESVQTDLHKNATKRRSSKRIWSMWTPKNGGFWRRSNSQQWASQNRSNVNAQKWISLAPYLLSGRSMWTHKNGRFSLRFCAKTESCERVDLMQQKRIITKK